eukprot:NODE_3586_length_949_cov_53.073333_g3295_i0.p1 GENE.NODE_3586_length_949_cov_53.073333_g3295_i0~~NODE_3586_length_949_cov_53.073333_g3295_i0.p1  ORF type:complete len:289 (-),score=33.66 NODE_3586_length_949_cov_53.073333_g3295_i0:27-893(-)
MGNSPSVKANYLASFPGHGRVKSICFVSEEILAFSSDAGIYLWDCLSAHLIKKVAENPSPALVAYEGKLISCCASEVVVDLESKVLGHASPISALTVTRNGVLVSGAEDGSLKAWDIRSDSLLCTLLGHRGRVNCLTADEHVLTSGAADHTLQLWSLSNWTHLLSLEGHSDQVLSCGISQDGLNIVSGSADHLLRLWHRSSGAGAGQIEACQGPVVSVLFLADQLLSGGLDGSIKIWNFSTGLLVGQLYGHSGSVTSVVQYPFSHPVLQVASGSHDGTIKLWSLQAAH